MVGRLRRAAASPLAWILLAIAVLRIAGIGWGLPASDGWDNDGIAPRDFLAGLVETFTPGHYFTYPPVHPVILGVLTSPVTIVALVKSPSLHPPDVVHEIIQVPYMTAIAYVARAVSVTMSLGIVWAMAKTAEELRGPRAGWLTAALLGVNAPLTYYAHTTNLDVPYLFWGCLALLAMVRAVARHEPRRLRKALAFAVLAVATKDQAYALFLLAAPAGLALWFLLDPWARENRRAVFKEVAVAAALAALLLLVADAVVFNPSGFRARFHFLVGSASQDFAQYSNDAHGHLLILEDTLRNFGRYYPPVFALPVVAAFVLLPRWLRKERGKLAASWLPFLCALSFTLAFNYVARRTDQRFLLPQYVFVALYAGVALEPIFFAPRLALLGRLIVAAALALGLFMALDVDANLLEDPRYDAERYLADRVKPGDTVEIYGLNVYQQRFDDIIARGVHVTRVGPEPPESRSPLPGVEEIRDTYANAVVRRPRWSVFGQAWGGRYLIDVRSKPTSGRILAPGQVEAGLDPDATTYFPALLRQELGFRWVHSALWTSTFWPRLDYHASTSREVWIFEREDAPR